jgi:DNA polymerase III epsilon subunit-like protein
MSALVFVDLETTGLYADLGDEVWEFAAIRREEDGTETRHRWFIQHDERLRADLPEPFRSDVDRRYDRKTALTREAFGDLLVAVFLGKPRLVGACPWFDASFLRLYVTAPSWSHRLVDVESLAAGHLGRLVNGLADAPEALGIEHPAAHTAMGDAVTAMRVYDAVMAGAA